LLENFLGKDFLQKPKRKNMIKSEKRNRTLPLKSSAKDSQMNL